MRMYNFVRLCHCLLLQSGVVVAAVVVVDVVDVVDL